MTCHDQLHPLPLLHHSTINANCNKSSLVNQCKNSHNKSNNIMKITSSPVSTDDCTFSGNTSDTTNSSNNNSQQDEGLSPDNASENEVEGETEGESLSPSTSLSLLPRVEIANYCTLPEV